MKKIFICVLVLSIVLFASIVNAANRWQKLNYLIPEPQCRMDEDTNGILQITEWTDARSQPTNTQIDAVLDQDVSDGTLDKEAVDAIESDKVKRLLFELNLDQENRLRVLEGSGSITKTQYKDVLIIRYKAL